MFKKAVVGALILVLLVGFGVWAVAGNNNDQDDSQTNNQSDTQNETSSNGSTQDQPQSQENEDVAEVTVTYDGDGFEPSTVSPISAGTAVKFVNESDGEVWVASDVHPTHEELPDFDTNASIGPGAEYTYTFSQAGTWTYHNHLDESQTGEVIVE